MGFPSAKKEKTRRDFEDPFLVFHSLIPIYSTFSNCSLGAPHLGHSLGRHRPSLVSPQAVHFHTAISLHLRF